MQAVTKSKGFTLLELMIVVAVIAILATIAVNSYTEQVRRGKRAEAKQALSDLQLREEKYRADNPKYGTIDQLTGSSAATTGYNNALKYYTISIDDASLTGSYYKITATRKGDLVNDPKCGNFTMEYKDNAYNKDVTSGDKAYCWGR
jgi:type IV pilus assembly protein PilE